MFDHKSIMVLVTILILFIINQVSAQVDCSCRYTGGDHYYTLSNNGVSLGNGYCDNVGTAIDVFANGGDCESFCTEANGGIICSSCCVCCCGYALGGFLSEFFFD